MNAIRLALAATMLAVAGTYGDVYARSAQKTTRLEGMDYLEARKTILRFGWAPLPGGCSGGGASAKLCGAYPEIGNCTGTGIGYCDMTFIRRDQCLLIVTVGGAPGTTKRHQPTVQGVHFGPGPCSKD